MKAFFVLIGLLVNGLSIYSQGAWTQKASLPGSTRQFAVGFSIGSTGYIGTGETNTTYFKDFWAYNPTSNVWTQKADLPGYTFSRGVGFSIGNKGYVGFGKNATYYGTGLYEYDPTTNTWSSVTGSGPSPRTSAVGFGIGTKGYVGTGMDNNANLKSDFWEYDPVTHVWTQKASFGGGVRWYAVGFSLNNKGYVGTGYNNAGNMTTDFWEYSPTSNQWVQKTSLPGVARQEAVGFSAGNYGYLGTGVNSSFNALGDFYRFDPISNTWLQIASISIRCGAVGFGIDTKGYVGTGWWSNYFNDFWQYDYCGSVTFTYTQTNVSCNGGNNGSITLTASGGTTPYVYSIDGGTTFQSSNVFSNLTIGTYVMAVKDANNCVSNSQSTTITQPTAVTFSTAQVNVPCFGGNNGSITVTASGGTNPYQYSKDGGINYQSSNTFLNLIAGSYSIKVKDVNNCLSAIQVITITQPTEITFLTNQINVTCFGGNSGSITVTASGGTPSYQYSKDGGATFQTSNIFSNLIAGTYVIKVKDNISCQSSTQNVIITQPTAPPTPIITPNGPTTFCLGGSVILTSSTGSSYLWSNGSTGQSITVSSSGTFFVTVTYPDGCSATSSITIVTVNPLPIVTITPSGPSAFCEGNSIILTASSGVNYYWSNGATTQSITVTTSGIYTVTVTDFNNCSGISSPLLVTVYPLPLKPTITANGTTLTSSALYGNQWYLNNNIIPGATNQTYDVTQNGSYTVMVTDANQCSNTSDPYNFTTIGINDFVDAEALLIIPNPNNGKFELNANFQFPGKIKIFNLNGLLVFESNLQKSIDLSSKPKGEYLMQIQSGNIKYFKKIIIQ